MRDSLSDTSTPTLQTYTPEEVRGFVRIEKLEPFMVKGYAKEVRPYPKQRKCYGRLELADQSLSFSISDHALPEEDSPVILREVIRFDSHNRLRLQGELVGSWKPTPVAQTPVIARKRDAKLPLYAFVATGAVPGIVFLTTPTAWEDICANVKGLGVWQGIRHHSPSFIHPSALQRP